MYYLISYAKLSCCPNYILYSYIFNQPLHVTFICQISFMSFNQDSSHNFCCLLWYWHLWRVYTSWFVEYRLVLIYWLFPFAVFRVNISPEFGGAMSLVGYHTVRGHNISLSYPWGRFDHLVKGLSSRFLLCKDTFRFVISESSLSGSPLPLKSKACSTRALTWRNEVQWG